MAGSAKTAGFLLFLLTLPALARMPTEPPEEPPAPLGGTTSTSAADAQAEAAAAAAAKAKAEASADGTVVGGDQDLNFTSSYREAAAAAVLVPNNNTESCLRVFGFAFTTREGSAVFGLPWRSAPCDLEQAADDAFAQGRTALGWRFKCKVPNVRRAFGSEAACLDAAGEQAGAELDRLRRQVDQLAERNKALSEQAADTARRFTAEEADQRCERQATACLAK